VIIQLIIGVILVSLIISGLIWWLFIETEGVYLGRRVVIWLYDVYASRYDNIKGYEQEFEEHLIAKPIIARVAPQKNPMVLDVATGTGRVPLSLLENSHFQGRIIGVDLSRKMLNKASEKLAGYDRRVSLIWGPAEVLPFPDESFDIITCLEALEFMINRRKVLQELIRVLRPGGTILLTNRINTHWMPGKTWTDEELFGLMDEYGLTNIESEAWQVDYRKVWGKKTGTSEPIGARPLGEILRCPRCIEELMVERDGEWFCEECIAWTRVGNDGVIEMYPLYMPHN